MSERKRSYAVLVIVTLVAVAFGVSACAHQVESAPAPPDPLERIPAEWIDLPEAPFVAQMQNGKAVLLNRATTQFNTVGVGCVVEKEGSVHVVRGLFSQDVCDAYYRPGQPVVGLLWMVNNIDRYIADQQRNFGRTDLIQRCSPGNRIAVVSAGLRGQSEWSAAGTPWPK